MGFPGKRLMTDSPDTPGMERQPRLLEQVRNEIRRRHYSYRTEQYLPWINSQVVRFQQESFGLSDCRRAR